MEIIKNRSFKEECSLLKKDINNVFFESCIFDHLILSDIYLEDIHFINCTFDHVFVESFYAKNLLIENCNVRSMSLRGNRKITSKKLFSFTKDRRVEELIFKNTNIDEVVLGGDLQVINCVFPKGDNYLHIKKPFLVYSECLRYVDENWTGEKKRIGVIELGDYISKEVERQNEDFITFSYNEYLGGDTNEILRSIFLLIKEFSIANDVLVM